MPLFFYHLMSKELTLTSEKGKFTCSILTNVASALHNILHENNELTELKRIKQPMHEKIEALLGAEPY